MLDNFRQKHFTSVKRESEAQSQHILIRPSMKDQLGRKKKKLLRNFIGIYFILIVDS